MDSSLLVTTVRNPTPDQLEWAKRITKEVGAKLVARKNHTTIRKMQQEFGSHQIISVGQRLTLHVDDQEIFFHPSMAAVRVKRLLNGDTDTAMKISGIQKGDHVLDCTLGMGADAIVFAYAVGPKGKVIGIEQSPLLAMLVREGLHSWVTDLPELRQSMRNIDVIAADHLAYLKEQPDHSVDVVYFDPMFRATVEESVNFDPVRALSNPNPISHESVQQAKRIARKSVVLKERLSSGEFERLGFPAPKRRSSSFTYSVIYLQEEHSN